MRDVADSRTPAGGQGELDDFLRMPELGSQAAHAVGQDVGAEAAVVRHLAQPQGLDVVALGEPRAVDVHRQVSGELGELGHRTEKATPDGLRVGALNQSGDKAVEIVHGDMAHMPGPELVVEFSECALRRPHGFDVRPDNSRPFAPRHLGIRWSDQPVAARADHRGNGYHGPHQGSARIGVGGPQLETVLHRLGDARSEVQPRSVDRIPAEGHANVLE